MRRKIAGPLRRVAHATASSGNAKIGEAGSTVAAQVSCPQDCVFLDGGGCYAEGGGTGFLTQQLNERAREQDASRLDVAKEEAAALDGLTVVPGRVMRLHAVGDCSTDATARIVAAAAERYMERGGGQVWTYTHAWRRVQRASWGAVSVLASCETPAAVEAAMRRGYAAELTVAEFPGRKAFDLVPTGRKSEDVPAKVIPCPAQTTAGVTCASCRLCMNSARLLEDRLVIGLEVHGSSFVVKRAHLALEDPSNPLRRVSSRDVLYDYVEEHEDWPTPWRLAKLSGVTESSAKDMLRRVRHELRADAA